MKLCKDCRHYTPLTTKLLWFTITVPDAKGLEKCGATQSPLDGSAAKFCDFERMPTGGCGPSARNFVLAYK